MSARVLKALGGYTILLSVLMLLPLPVVILGSLTADGLVRVPPDHWGIRWYVMAVNDEIFVGAFKTSVMVAVVVATIATFVGVSAGLAITRYSFPGRDTIHMLLMAPAMLPHVVLAIGLLQLLAAVKLQPAPVGLIVGHTVVVLPFVLRLVTANLSGLDPTLEPAAYSLGASRVYTFRRVLLPLIAPGLLAGMLFAFLLSFDESTISIFLSQPGVTTLPAQILNYVENRSDPLVTAVSAVMVILAMLVLLIIDRAFGFLGLLVHGKATERQTMAR